MTIWIGQAVDPNYGLTERADYFAMPTVAVDTEPGRGSRFSFGLPATG